MTEPPSLDAIAELYTKDHSLEIGGKWSPANCSSRSRLAVVMTYRNRSKSIKLMLQHLHRFLQKQLIQYQMFIIEPPADAEFNRGLLKNIGFVESGKRGDFQCVVFQDIDLLPENDNNLYHCPDMPRHLVVAIDTRHYKPLFGGAVFGGAVLFRREHFQSINGFSNYYFGWGGEDDDLLDRVRHGSFKVQRPPAKIGRYREVKHEKCKRGKTTRVMYKTRKYRFSNDGLNTLEYNVQNVTLHPIYTWIYVTYNETLYKVQAGLALKEAFENKNETGRNSVN